MAQLTLLTDEIIFPDPEKALSSGLLAIGGDLKQERLLKAYRSGIFPWFSEDEQIQWWSPDPRFVLFPENLYISKSMQQLLKRNSFRCTVNHAFEEVIQNCAEARKEEGTWITDSMKEAYCVLHQSGYAVSVEAWSDGILAGGLYGIRMGPFFFGESMFSSLSNASKYAFIRYVQQLQEQGVILIDCQVHTTHLESLGASFITRKKFLDLLHTHLPEMPA
jgi:leucyl/phenylalanyl-tRNA--protein transferase